MVLNSIEANKGLCRVVVLIQWERGDSIQRNLHILSLPLIPSSSFPTAVLGACKFLAFQISSAPWPCVLLMERWREVVVLGNARVYVLILALIVPQYGACPCHLMQWVGEKGHQAALGCDCSSTRCKPCSYQARISDPVKYVMYLPQKTIGSNKAREGTMLNSFITEQSRILLDTFNLPQSR